MDDVIFDDGSRRLRVCVVGMDRQTGAVSEAEFGLSVYAFHTEPDVTPIFTHVLDIEGARRLYSFLNSISLLKDDARAQSGRFLELDVDVPASVVRAFSTHPALAENPALVRAVLEMNPDLCRAVLETQVETLDITSLAYRRDQLAIMRQLLASGEFFRERQEHTRASGRESVWQQFFEQNQWIFGYGLNYVIGEGIQPNKLEQVVAGYSIASAGKRVDGLLHTRGVLRSLCYVEIKTHDTPLLHGTEYRADVWRPSHELAGAVAQSQKTVQLAIEHLRSRLDLPVDAGERGGASFFNYTPRSVVVCGDLKEFVEESGIHAEKFGSFELYRRSIHAPDIITFDELNERAAAIVETGFAARQLALVSER